MYGRSRETPAQRVYSERRDKRKMETSGIEEGVGVG